MTPTRAKLAQRARNTPLRIRPLLRRPDVGLEEDERQRQRTRRSGPLSQAVGGALSPLPARLRRAQVGGAASCNPRRPPTDARREGGQADAFMPSAWDRRATPRRAPLAGRYPVSRRLGSVFGCGSPAAQRCESPDPLSARLSSA